MIEAPGTQNRVFLKKYNCSAAIQKNGDGGVKIFAYPGYLIGSEISKLVNRGYQQFLKTTKNPPYDGEVKYGDRAEHCWNGDPSLPNYLSRLHYHTMYLDKILDRMKKTAPAGADLTSWRY